MSRGLRHPSPTLAGGALLVVLAAVGGPGPCAQESPSAKASGGLFFVDATPLSGIDHRNVCGAPTEHKGWNSEILGAGAAWLDYDGDGNLDLYIVNGSAYDRPPGRGEPNKLYRGDGKGRFVDVTTKAGVGDRGWGLGVAVGDLDNDGDPDLYVTNFGPNVLYRNNGDGTFTDVTKHAGVGNALLSASAAFFDIEGDGDLDLYVTNYHDCDPEVIPRRDSEAAQSEHCRYRGIPVACGPLGTPPLQDALYRNKGDGTFEDVTRASGAWLDTPRYALGVVTADYDNDGDQDIYVANDSVQNSLWQNRGDGTFVDVGVPTLTALSADGKAQAGMGADFGDYNRDGLLDLVVTNFSHGLNTVYKNVNGKFFIDDSALAGMGVTMMALSWGTGFFDFDHDGDQDLFIANGHIYPQVDDYRLGLSFRQANHLFVNEGDRFQEGSAASGPGLRAVRSFRGAAFGDYDNDGDIDVFVTALDDVPLLLRNDSRGTGHWLQVRLEGTKSNRDGVGARVTITVGGQRQVRERTGGGSYLSASDPRLHFGLGSATKVDVLEVRWPSGQTDVLRNVAADQVIAVKEGQGSTK